MANKTLLAQIKQRSDTAANWTTKDPVIGNGELIIVETSAGEKRFKVGDGEKTFTQLPYADENILSKIKNYTAGDGINISDAGVISSTGGGGSSDVFVIEFTHDGGNITGASKTFDETKQAIESKKVIMVFASNYSHTITEAVTIGTNEILLIAANYINGSTYMFDWNSNGVITYSYLERPEWNNESDVLSNSGAVYWNASNKKWEIKEITSGATYKAGNGISISSDGTISVTAAKIYSGTSDTPSADLGENGDIYIQTEG